MKQAKTEGPQGRVYQQSDGRWSAVVTTYRRKQGKYVPERKTVRNLASRREAKERELALLHQAEERDRPFRQFAESLREGRQATNATPLSRFQHLVELLPKAVAEGLWDDRDHAVEMLKLVREESDQIIREVWDAFHDIKAQADNSFDEGAAAARERMDELSRLITGLDRHAFSRAVTLGPGFYVYYLWGDDQTKPLYVGQTINLLQRLGKHMADKASMVKKVTFQRCKDAAEMDKLEREMIRHYQPVLNSVGIVRSVPNSGAGLIKNLSKAGMV